MKVIIAGDFAPKARLAKQIEDKKFSDIFSDDLRTLIKSADFSFLNFECPVVEDGYQAISKYGPNLYCIPEATEAVKYAGFTGITMANNHILDYGINGLNKTVDCFNSLGLKVVGVGSNLNDSEKILYLEKKNKILAIINCCEHEFSVATNESAGANPLNPVRQFYAIREARKQADYVLVIVHGGHEYYQLPSLRMQEVYRFFIDVGADVVVNHHQHCYSGYEIYNDKVIFYGLGNFGFDVLPMRVNDNWNYGYLVELEFNNSIKYKIYPYYQYGVKPTIELLDYNSFDTCLNELNSIIIDKNKLSVRVSEYYSQCEKYEYALLEPYTGRVFSKLFNWGVLPQFIKGTKLSAILNHIDCESHRDKLLYTLRKRVK